MRLEQEVNIYGDAEILKRFQAAETSISVVQGNISALISESELIELQNSHTTMYSQMASLKLDVDDLELSFSDLQTKYNTVTGQYTELSSKVAEYKAGVDGLSADITAVEQNLSQNYSTTSVMNAAIAAKANEITASVSNTYATKTALNNANSEIDALQSWKNEASLKITDSAIVATVTSSGSWATKADKANLISQINQSAEQVAISASKIKLEGIITANGNFKILADGSMETIAGKIGGWTISGNNLMDDRTDFLVRIAAPTVYGGDGNGNADVLVVRDKTNDTYPLVISSNGQVLATRCKFEGGTIGGWKINFTNLKSPSGNLTIDSATGTISTQRTNGNKGVAFYDDGIELYSWALDGNFIGRISTGNFSDTLVQAVTFYSDYGDMIIFGMQTQTKDKTNVQLALSDRETNGYKIGINAMKTIHAFGDIYSRSKLYIGSSNANPYFQLNSDGGIFVSTSKLYVAGIISGDAVYSAGRRTATCNNQIYFQWEPSMGKIAVFVDSTFIGYLSFQ